MTSQEVKLIKSSRALVIFGIILCIFAFILPNIFAPSKNLGHQINICTIGRPDDREIQICKANGVTIANAYSTADTINLVTIFAITAIFVGIGVYQLRALKTVTSPNVIPSSQPVNTPPATTSTLDKRLVQLQDLKVRGIIDDDEYKQLREKAINDS